MIMKKIVKQVVLLLLMLLVLSTAAYAAGMIDAQREVTLAISYQDGDTHLVGAEFCAFLVATADDVGELTATDTFAQFNVDIQGRNDAAWKTLASTLEGYVLRDGIAPTDSGKTDKDGTLTFPTGDGKLVMGLYLVLGQRHTQDGYRYDAAPFMVMLPTQDAAENEWLYDVTVTPKYDSAKLPDTPTTVTRKVLKVWNDADNESQRPKEIIVQLLRDGEVYDTVTLNAANNWRYAWAELDDSYTWTVAEKECKGYTVRVERNGITFVITNTALPDEPKPPKPSTPDKPSLPQTGQLWWPVPILLLVGLMLVVIGLFLRKRSKDNA